MLRSEIAGPRPRGRYARPGSVFSSFIAAPELVPAFGDDAAWDGLFNDTRKPVGEFRAVVEFISDPGYAGALPEQVVTLASSGSDRGFVFVVAELALSHPDHPILVLDLYEDPGSTFRVIPSRMWSVENNLSLSNTDFSEFAENLDHEGVFRGFGE